MSKPTIAPYGSWKSPITAGLIAAKTIGLGGPEYDGGQVYWSELRPQEGGRIVVVRRAPDGTVSDVTPPDFNARTRVHEYGGHAYTVAEGTVFFSNFADQRLYRQDPGQAPRPLTPEAALFYADCVVDRGRGLLFCVREDHREGRERGERREEAVNTLAAVRLDGDEAGGRVIVQGHDFYASPRLSPDGARLAWLAWNHPNMPWDGTELWVGELAADGSISRSERVAGGPDESIFQPEWSPDGELYFVSDRTDWWNLYRLRAGQAEALCPMEAEFGQPQWVFGLSNYAFESAGRLVCAYSHLGRKRLALLDTDSLSLQEVRTPYTDIEYVRAAPGQALFVAGSPIESWVVVRLDLATRQLEVLRRSTQTSVDTAYFSWPEPIEFPTEGGLTAHAFYYSPHNPDFVAPTGGQPPLIVMSHGGPTSAVSNVLALGIQYWTSRGFAVVNVNYGGSTGYGRAYRQRLNGQWGLVDVDDCANAARYLAARGQADPRRMAIRGGSAGGYTTLSTLAFRDVFQAGASHFGISDLEALARDTHKFESRYLDNLVGPYPERRDLYQQRSPIHFTHQLNCALILFQGAEDLVVPPDQSRKMFEAVRAKELPVAYVEFPGEQHGFRRAENIIRSLEAELYFYGRVFGFELAEPVEAVPIENL